MRHPPSPKEAETSPPVLGAAGKGKAKGVPDRARGIGKTRGVAIDAQCSRLGKERGKRGAPKLHLCQPVLADTMADLRFRPH